jgi:hypothetical protein
VKFDLGGMRLSGKNALSDFAALTLTLLHRAQALSPLAVQRNKWLLSIHA